MDKYIFLIQTDSEGQVMHDFSFALLQAIKFDKWWNDGETNYNYSFTDKPIKVENTSNVIPIGSVEFVLEFYNENHNIDYITPINIPKELTNSRFLKRRLIEDIDKEDKDKEVFVKSKDKIKEYTNIIKIKDIPKDKNLLISDFINIDSEWRAFIYNKKLLDIRNYSGEFSLFPNIDLINEMIREYKDSPIAYTLDVGINKNGTFLIEIHHFFSCGLYGFDNYKYLPKMFITTHNEILNKFYK